MNINRKVPKEETLEILPCPHCGGEVLVIDCGYTTFNPGNASCEGECNRDWRLGYVEDRWHAGEKWNLMQPKAKEIDDLEERLRELKGNG